MCVGENISSCNPYILPRQDANLTIRAIVGNMPEINAEKPGYPTCLLTREDTDAIEVAGVHLGKGLVVCSRVRSTSTSYGQLEYNTICGDPTTAARKGNWRVSLVLSDRFDKFRTSSLHNTEEGMPFIRCFGTVQTIRVCGGAQQDAEVGGGETPGLCAERVAISTAAAQKKVGFSSRATEAYIPELRVQLRDAIDQALPVNYQLTISLKKAAWQQQSGVERAKLGIRGANGGVQATEDCVGVPSNTIELLDGRVRSTTRQPSLNAPKPSPLNPSQWL